MRLAAIWPEAFGIDLDRERLTGRRLKLDAEISCLWNERGGCVADDLRRVTRTRSHRELMGVEAREIEQVAHQAFEASTLGPDDRGRALAFVGSASSSVPSASASA